MFRMYKRIGGLMALAVTAGVSMLAGGVLLGGAYADGGEEDAKPTFAVQRLNEVEGDFPVIAMATGCLISLEALGEGAEPPPIAAASINVARLPHADGIPAPAFTLGSGGGLVEGTTVEVRTLTEDEIADIKARLAELRSNPDTDECTVVEGSFADGMLTPPSGGVVKFAPATKVE